MIQKIPEILLPQDPTIKSKLYTPFTTFTIFFAIYFNAETLGDIFLSGDWETQKSALSNLKTRSIIDWLEFFLKVISFSLGMLTLYGAGQALSALIWGGANRANIALARITNLKGFVSIDEYNKLAKRESETASRERELTELVSNYHNWSPFKIKQLNEELEELREYKIQNNDETIRVNEISNEANFLREKLNLAEESQKSAQQASELNIKSLTHKLTIEQAKSKYFLSASRTNSKLIKQPSKDLKSLIYRENAVQELFDFTDKRPNKITSNEVTDQTGALISILENCNLIENVSFQTQDTFFISFKISPGKWHKIRTIRNEISNEQISEKYNSIEK